MIVVEGASRSGAEKVAETVRRTAHEPVTLGSGSMQVTVSVGISLCPEQGTEPEGLIAAADHAMYLVKRRGRAGQLVYPGRAREAASERARPSRRSRARPSRLVTRATG